MQYEENSSLIIKILNNSASFSEQELFDKWLKESEHNQAHYKKVKILWEEYGQLYENIKFDEKAAMEKIRKKVYTSKPGQRIYKMRPWYWVAASILLLLASALWINLKHFTSENDLLTFKTGDFVKEIALSDGSHIWLNKNSQLVAPHIFSKSRREVSLEGEAFFEVKRDATRPFRIIAGKTSTKVLGTSFNINYNKESGNVNIIVNSGKVAFYETYSLKSKEILLPGTKGSFNSEKSQIVLSSNNNPNYISWKTGILTFYDTPLDEVCHTLSKQFQKEIVADITNTELTLTANFDNETLENILEVIKITIDIEVIQTDNKIIIHK